MLCPSKMNKRAPSLFCFLMRRQKSSLVLIDQLDRLFIKFDKKTMKFIAIFNALLSIECFFTFNARNNNTAGDVAKDYSGAYNCTTSSAFDYGVVCLCLPAGRGKCQNFFAVTEACSVTTAAAVDETTTSSTPAATTTKPAPSTALPTRQAAAPSSLPLPKTTPATTTTSTTEPASTTTSTTEPASTTASTTEPASTTTTTAKPATTTTESSNEVSSRSCSDFLILAQF